MRLRGSPTASNANAPVTPWLCTAYGPDGRLSVLNQYIKRSGNVDQATGVAKVVDPVSRAKLKVSFVSFLGWRPFWGDYWVIGLDDDYRWAVVGSPDRRYGWVLARCICSGVGTAHCELQPC